MIIGIKANKTCIKCGKKVKKGEWITIYESGRVIHNKCKPEQTKNVSVSKK